MTESEIINNKSEFQSHTPKKQTDKNMNLDGLRKNLITVVAIVIPLFAIVYQELLPQIGVFMYPEAYTMFFVGLVLFLLFLQVPSTSNGNFAWYDVFLALIGLIGSLYVGIFWEDIYNLGTMQASTWQLVIGILMIIAILEATRRSVGWPMVIVASLALVYIFVGNMLPGFLNTAKFSIENAVGYTYLSNQGIFGMPSQIVATILIGFITFGSFLSATGAGTFYLDLALSAAGRLRGGAAKVAVIASAFAGTMTGEPLSNIGIVGPMTLPLMKRLGYDDTFSAATVAVSSCGSMIMPPVMAAVAFLMAQMTGLGYVAIVVAAIIPAILYFFAVYWQIDFHCAKKEYQTLPKEEIPKTMEVLKKGWQYLVPVAVLIYFLLILRYNPATSVYRSLLALLIVSFIKEKKTVAIFKTYKDALILSGKAILPTAAVCAAAGIVMSSVTVTGLGIKMSAILNVIANGNILILALLAAATVYILGMGLAPIVSYILMAILVAPAMIQMDINILAAHFFILYMSISTFITPPFALASYMASSYVGADGMKTSLYAVRLGIVCYIVPFLVIYEPALLLQGTFIDVVKVTISTMLGLLFFSAAVEGYFISRLAFWLRILFLIGGSLMIYPGIWTDLIGVAIAIIPIIMQVRDNKNKGNHSPSMILN